MFAALLTSLLFALSGVAGKQTTSHYRALDANFFRLAISLVFLFLIWWALGAHGWELETAWWLIWSGVIGFGLGDIALFLAYGWLGSRLTVLTVFATAPAIAAVVEWAWLGEGISGIELGAMLVVGIGLAIVFLNPPRDGGPIGKGVLFALLGGMGQGVGAVLSRKANLVGEVQEGFAGGLGQALLRVAAGTAIALLAMFFVNRKEPFQKLGKPLVGFSALVAAGLTGPVLGVSFFQLAILEMPSGITLAIVAISPLLILPFSWWLEGDRPTFRSVVGTVVAVGGVAWLCLVRG